MRLESRRGTIVGCALIVLMGLSIGIQLYNTSSLFSPSKQAYRCEWAFGSQCAWALSSPTSYISGWVQLISAGGVPVTGSQTINFSLYNSASLTTAAHHIYCETDSVTLDSSGFAPVQLGSGTACSGSSWGESWPPSFSVGYWVDAQVGAVDYGKTPFTATPYFDGQVSWGQVTGAPAFLSTVAAFSTGCGSGGSQVNSVSINSLGTLTATCSADPVYNLLSTSTSTACGANSYLQTASHSATLTSVDAAFGCAAGPATTIGSTSFATSCASGSMVTSDSFSASATTANYAATCAQEFIPLFETSTQSMSAVALTAITGCTFSLAASTTYYIDLTIPYTMSVATDGIGVAFTDTALTAANLAMDIPTNAANRDVIAFETATSATTASSTGPSGGVVFGIHVFGEVQQNTAASLGFSFAVKATAGTTSTATVFGCFGTATVV